MKTEEAIKKLYALVKDLKKGYLTQLNDASEKLIVKLNIENKEGILRIREIAKSSIDEFQLELEKISKKLEEKIQAHNKELGHEVGNETKKSEEEIKKSFSEIFERVYEKIINFFSAGE